MAFTQHEAFLTFTYASLGDGAADGSSTGAAAATTSAEGTADRPASGVVCNSCGLPLRLVDFTTSGIDIAARRATGNPAQKL